MRRLLVTIVFCLFIFTFNVKAVEEEWVKSFYCEPTLGLVTFNEAVQDGLVQSPFKDRDGFVDNVNLAKYCVNKSLVGSLVDYNKDNTFLYCRIDQEKNIRWVTGYDSKEEGNVYPRIASAGIFGAIAPCCPINTRYYNGSKLAVNWPTNYCCPTKGDVSGGTCSDGTPAIDYHQPNEASVGSVVFPEASTVYTCPNANCFLDSSGNEPTTNVRRFNLSEMEKYNYRCYPSVEVATEADPDTIINNKYICLNGELIDKTEYEKWGSLIGLYGSCLDLLTETEQQTCINCYAPCAGYSSCPLIYNSLGCVDTNPQGLITRVFQIGIGIIGGVGMVRVMQAAFMRQSGDPAKIKESYDIISSVVIGAILLIFGVIILRYIGINVLQILPFDFLQ